MMLNNEHASDILPGISVTAYGINETQLPFYTIVKVF